MDPVINSQLQSPLARNLQHIAADTTTFTYHIEQNAPPLSLHKTLVNPQSSRTGFDNTYNFRVPQYGQLAKMTLKLTYQIKPYQRTHVTPVLPLYHMIDRIDLMSHNNVIETHFGDTIMIKHAYYSSAETAATKIMGQLNVPIECDNYVDIAELFKSTKDGTPFNPFDKEQWNSDHNCRYVTLFCEVPLSFTDNPAMYLDTRFVEFLDVSVRLQSTKHGQPLFMAAACVELDMGEDNIQLDPRKHSNTACAGLGYMNKADASVPSEVSVNTTVGENCSAGNVSWRWLEPGTGFQQGQVVDHHTQAYQATRTDSTAQSATGVKGAAPYETHSFAEDVPVPSVFSNGFATLTGAESSISASGTPVSNKYTNLGKIHSTNNLGRVSGPSHFFYRPFYTRVCSTDTSMPEDYMDCPGNMFMKPTGHAYTRGSAATTATMSASSTLAVRTKKNRCDAGLITVITDYTAGTTTYKDITAREYAKQKVRLGSEIGGLGYVPVSATSVAAIITGDNDTKLNIATAKKTSDTESINLITKLNSTRYTQNAHAPGANIYELQLGARPKSRVTNLGPQWMSGFYATVDADGYSAAAHSGEPRFIRVGACNFDQTHYTTGFWGYKEEKSDAFGHNPSGISSTATTMYVREGALSNLSMSGGWNGKICKNDGTEIGNANNDNGEIRSFALKKGAMFGFDKITCASIAALWANFGGMYVYSKVDVHGTMPFYNPLPSGNQEGLLIGDRGQFESRFSAGATLGSGDIADAVASRALNKYRVEINTANCVIERFYAMYPYLNVSAVPGLNNTGTWPAGSAVSSSSSSGHGSISDIKVEGSLNNSEVHGVPAAADVNLGLLCTFLHLHDKVREEVSMNNFKDNMPATILYHDTYAEYQNVVYGDASSAYAKNTDTSMIIPLRSKHLAYAITVIAYRNRSNQELVGGDVYNTCSDGATPMQSRMDVSLTKGHRAVSRSAYSDVSDVPVGDYKGSDVYVGCYSKGTPGDPALITGSGLTDDGRVEVGAQLTSGALSASSAIEMMEHAIESNSIGDGGPVSGTAADDLAENYFRNGDADTSCNIGGPARLRIGVDGGANILNELDVASTAPAFNTNVAVTNAGAITASSSSRPFVRNGLGTSNTHYEAPVGRGTDPVREAGMQTGALMPQKGDKRVSPYDGPQIPSKTGNGQTAIWPNYKVVENFKTVKPTYIKLGIAGRTIYETAAQTATASSYYSVSGGSFANAKGSGQWHAEKDLDNLPFHYNEGNNRGEGGSICRIANVIEDSTFAGTLCDHMDATVITFGLNKTDELSNNGSLGLSSATNAQLELKFAEPCRVSIYVHHHATLQIDSNTGVMSRSLDV